MESQKLNPAKNSKLTSASRRTEEFMSLESYSVESGGILEWLPSGCSTSCSLKRILERTERLINMTYRRRYRCINRNNLQSRHQREAAQRLGAVGYLHLIERDQRK